MTDNYNRITDDRNLSGAARNWDSPLAIAPGSNMRALVSALLSEADRMDSDLEDIYAAQHINSATDGDLDTWGRLVRVDRKTGEGDDSYRARIKAEFRQSTIGTTFDEFTEFSAAVLNTDISNLDFTLEHDRTPATVLVGADASVYNNINLSNSDVVELLGGGVPAGHAVRVIERGTFEVKADGATDDADKGLTSDGITTGGTLGRDVA